MTTTTKQNIGIGTTYEISQKFSTFLFEEKYKYSICSSNILGGNIMKKNSPYRKGVVITIIVLFTSLFIIPNITVNIKDRDLQQKYDRLTCAFSASGAARIVTFAGDAVVDGTLTAADAKQATIELVLFGYISCMGISVPVFNN